MNKTTKTDATAIAGSDMLAADFDSSQKICKSCIWWKRVMLKSHPDTIYLCKTFPCHEPIYLKTATFGDMNKGKTENDSCDRWAYDRP